MSAVLEQRAVEQIVPLLPQSPTGEHGSDLVRRRGAVLPRLCLSGFHSTAR
jgi:hypothetical protein